MNKVSNITQRGFTLIEMMAALAVISVGVAAAISLVSSMGLNTSRLEEKMHAQWIASNAFVQIKLEQLEKFNASPLKGSQQIEFGGREWFLFSKNKPSTFANSIETTINICLDQQQDNCVLEQVVYSNQKKLPLAGKLETGTGTGTGTGGTNGN